MEPGVTIVMNEGEERALVCVIDDDACLVDLLVFAVGLTPCMSVSFLMLSHIAWTRCFVCFGECEERLAVLMLLLKICDAQDDVNVQFDVDDCEERCWIYTNDGAELVAAFVGVKPMES